MSRGAWWLLLTCLVGCDDAEPIGADAVARDAAVADTRGGDGSVAAVTEPPEAIVCPPPTAVEDDAGAADRALYRQAAEVLFARCGQTRCHGPLPYNDLLDLSTARCDVRQALVGVPACEYPAMARVQPGEPERSWLMVKLTAPHDPQYALIFEPELGAQQALDPRCADADFGLRMPPPGYAISDEEVDVIRTWIAAGAPGPD